MPRIAVVTDIHHGRDTFTKRGSAALTLLRRFVEFANGEDMDAVIEMGDRISDEDHERDLTLAREVSDVLKELRAPRHHVCGNHDMAYLSLAENEAILDAPLRTRVVAIGDMRLVFWQPDVQLTRERGFHLADGDLAALERALHADDGRTLLVSHVPLSGGSMRGNFWFENNVGHAAYAETPAIRELIARAPCPVAAISGHVHWNSANTVDGSLHVTQQSLTESFTTGDAPAASFGLLSIDGETLSWRVTGEDPIELKAPFPMLRPVWSTPLPRFSEIR
jgi:predicted phosphodiesterase